MNYWYMVPRAYNEYGLRFDFVFGLFKRWLYDNNLEHPVENHRKLNCMHSTHGDADEYGKAGLVYTQESHSFATLLTVAPFTNMY